MASPPNLVLRPARPEDAPRIAVVHRDAWLAMIRPVLPEYPVLPLGPGRWVERWGKALAEPETPRQGVVVWEAGEALFGVAWLGPFKNTGPGTEDRALLRRLFIAPAVQGRGLGSTMLRWAEDHARAGGARQLELWCLDVNVAAVEWYRKRGYTTDGASGGYAREGRELTKRRYRKRLDLEGADRSDAPLPMLHSLDT